MDDRLICILAGILLTVHSSETVISSSSQPYVSLDSTEEPPEGYYAFIESPGAEPPKVRRPPYVQSEMECPGLKKNKGKINPHIYKTLSLCGDLNKGYIPKNPMMQNVLGNAYPFELIKNKTLQFFSKVLPILKADDTLPKVAKYQYLEENDNKIDKTRSMKKRSLQNPTTNTTIEAFPRESITKRTGRKFCDNNDGVLCLLYKAFQGDSVLTAQTFHDRKDEINNEAPEYRRGETTLPALPRENSLPPTPCPAKVEYVTPVFARNYQGVWRYVVQIPYEGYFTQTIEVTRCLNSRCHYIEGSCMSSPRWTSVLVAEIYYPNTYLPSKPLSAQSGTSWPGHSHRHSVSSENPPPIQDFQNYQQYLQKRAGLSPGSDKFEDSSVNESKKSMQCDGVDEIGCFQDMQEFRHALAPENQVFQHSRYRPYYKTDKLTDFNKNGWVVPKLVRLYYDWFLVPGSCKCWKPDYFSRYMRRKATSPELQNH